MKRKLKRRLLAMVLTTVLCLTFNMTAFAAMGYGSGYGYTGTFYVDVPEGGSNGRITVGIESPEQDQTVWFKITGPNGVVWNRSSVGVLPNNGAEILSPVYSNFASGKYKVEFTCLTEIRFNCWIYNW